MGAPVIINGGRRPIKKKHEEDRLQIGIVHLLKLDFLPEDLIFAAVPNGGLRSKAEAAKLKAMGVLPGLNDLLFWWANGGHGLIEIKTTAPGSCLSDDQIIVRRRMTALGHKYAIARNYETLRDQLIAWGVPCQHRVKFT